MTSPSMVQRAGDTLVVRSLVSGDQLFVNDSAVESLSEDADCHDEVMNGDDDRDLPQCKIRRNYSCSHCTYFTQNPRHFLYHLRDVHQEKVKIYECPNCLYASKHFQKLLRHMKMVHGNYDSLEFSDASKTKLHKKKKHSEIENSRKADNESKVEYEPTDKRSRQQSNKQFEDMVGKSMMDFKCSLCPFTTRHQGQLTRHEKQEHIKTKFFRCSKCSYVTHIKARFTKHVKYHSMPMIKCDLCDFRTPYKWNLDRHYKNHNGHGSFRCSACNFTADIKQSLTVHEMNHHIPPVGQAAGLGVSRRRNKVGASDTAAEDEENELRQERERERNRETLQQQEEFPPQTSTPKQSTDDVKNKQLKVSMKKSKNSSHHSERHNFYMDFIHSDDIIHHSNGNIYIKKKCKYCNFKTAWDTEMARHEYKIHSIGSAPLQTSNLSTKKVPRPIPNLIPIQYSPTNHDTNIHSMSNIDSYNMSEEKSDTNNVIDLADIKDLSAKAGFSSLHDFISLFGDEETELKNETNTSDIKSDTSISSIKPLNNSVQSPILDTNSNLKRKHTSFFDNLKAKLMTNAGESCNLTCKWCGHESKCLSEMAGHQKTCGKELNNTNMPSKIFNVSSTRCQYCRQRCKSSIDLLNHLNFCPNYNQNDPKNQIDVKSETSETYKGDEISLNEESQDPHPMENVVFVWNNISQPVEHTDNKLVENVQEVHIENASTPEPYSSTFRIPTPECEVSVDVTPPTLTNTNAKMPTHGTDLDMVMEGKRVFKCPHCSFWASTASRFHVHIVGHLNKKPFECSLCSYRSNWRWDITKHIRLKSVRDSAHSKARVLMTDETGRRNYSKYNKYLTQMKSNKNEQSHLSSQGETKDRSKNTKSSYDSSQGHSSPNQNLPSPPKLVKTTSNTESKQQIPISLLRPPPPLKPAYMTSFQKVHEQNKKKNDPDIKKTLFQCKKCNFRDANRENILMHVKGHYRQDGSIESTSETNNETNLDDEVSVSSSDAPFRCGHCHQVSNWKHVIQRHCRLKHNGNVHVVIGGKNGIPEKIEIEEQLDESDLNDIKQEELYRCVHCPYIAKSITEIENHTQAHMTKQESDLKCCFCSFLAFQKFELYNHLKLHGVNDPEDYINKSVPYKLVYPENTQMYIKKYQCTFCPYLTDSKSQFLYHKQFHKLRGAPYKCKYCSYNVTKRHLLQQHLRLHKSSNESNNEINDIKNENINAIMPQMDTQLLKDCPLVWVSKDGKFSKMFKCRFCPHLNVRKVNIQEHEKMHSEHEESNTTGDEVSYRCPDCSYTCNNAGVLSAHFKVHQGINGQIHCFVDLNKTDTDQINELTALLNRTNVVDNVMTIDDSIENFEISGDIIDCDVDQNDTTIEITDIEAEKILFFCQQCPARYLSEKELENHIRFHGSRLFYRCEYCSYTDRQRPHLLSHYNVHTHEYQIETKNLQSEYLTSKNHLQPYVNIVEGAVINNQSVWTIVESNVKTISPQTNAHESLHSIKETNKKFACTKCPTKFYNNELLAYHMTLHGGKHPYKCHICDYSAITRNNLEKHEKIHIKANIDERNNETSPIQVTIGNVQIMPGTNLYQQIMDAKKQLDQKEPQFTNLQGKNNALASHVNIKNKNISSKRYKCIKCPSSFEKRDQYKIHMSLHGSNQRYCCDKCDYSVRYYANYVQHLKKHDKEILKQNIDDCNEIKEIIIEDIDDENNEELKLPKLAVKSLQPNSKRGALKLTLADRQALMLLQEIRNNNINREINTEERKLFWCPHCPYTSHRRDAVDNHINRHICVSGIRRNYTCDHCDYTVPQSHFLREHTNIHFTSLKYYQCDGYMESDLKKLSYDKYEEDRETDDVNEESENIIFEEYEIDDESNKKKYKPNINIEIENIKTDIKIFIDPKTQEIIENYKEINNELKIETKDNEKSTS